MATYKITYDYIQKRGLHAVTYKLHMTTYDHIQITSGYIVHTNYIQITMGYILTIHITYRLHGEDRLPRYVLYVAYVAVCSYISSMKPA